MEKNEFSLVFSATDSLESAKKIAKSIVEKRLAAGVNIIPGNSTFRWDGEVVERDEHIMIFYTRSGLSEGLADMLKGLHPYEVPAAVAVDIEYGLHDFLEWISNNTASSIEDY